MPRITSKRLSLQCDIEALSPLYKSDIFPLYLLYSKGWCRSYFGGEGENYGPCHCSLLSPGSQTPAEPLRGTLLPNSTLTYSPCYCLLPNTYTISHQQFLCLALLIRGLGEDPRRHCFRWGYHLCRYVKRGNCQLLTVPLQKEFLCKQ